MFWKQTYIVMQHQEALLFKDGRLIEKVGPGKYVRWGRHFDIQRFDKWLTQVIVPNQEVACADGVSVKVSARMDYRPVDIEKLYMASVSAPMHLYTLLHETVRVIVGALPIDEVMSQRQDLSKRILEEVGPKAAVIGVEVVEAGIRDLGVSGEIKRAYGQLLVAQKEAQAALERARGETAALRNLANAAKMMDSNPNLLQLRWIHALGQAKGATIVLSPSGMVPSTIASPEENES